MLEASSRCLHAWSALQPNKAQHLQPGSGPTLVYIRTPPPVILHDKTHSFSHVVRNHGHL
jgi:hypothetical protein